MFYASPIPGSVSVDYWDYFLAFRKGRKDAKVECFQIKWKNLSNTHLLLKISCVQGNENLHAYVSKGNNWAEDNIPT